MDSSNTNGTYTSAISLTTLFAMDSEFPGTPTRLDETISKESLIWQQFGARRSSLSMIFCYGENGVVYANEAFTQSPALRIETIRRLGEINSLMGSAGEQLALAWAADLDCRRALKKSETLASSNKFGDEELALKIQVRALSETSAYFVLGAAHALGNIVLRVACLSSQLRSALKIRPGMYLPGSDDHSSWPGFDAAINKLAVLDVDSSSESFMALVGALRDLKGSNGFRDLKERRGSDFHRRRPQSVMHVPVVGPSESVDAGGGSDVVGIPAPSFDDRSSGKIVRCLSFQGMEQLFYAMVRVRKNLPRAIRGFDINYPG